MLLVVKIANTNLPPLYSFCNDWLLGSKYDCVVPCHRQWKTLVTCRPIKREWLVLRPGFGPGSSARKAGILDRTILPERLL
jgi:hypothetical protein